MAKKYYLPRGEYNKLTWLNNFAVILPKYKDTFNLTDEEMDTVYQYKLGYNYCIALLMASKTYSKQCTSFKTAVSGGALKKKSITVPEMVMPPDIPAVFNAGTFTYISNLIRRIKAKDTYSDTIGKALDIIGVERNAKDTDDLMPVLSFKVIAGIINLKYIKKNSDGAIIESKRGDEKEFSFLAKVNKPVYIDNRTNLIEGQPEKRHYRAWFFKNDIIVGQVSSVISVLVN